MNFSYAPLFITINFVTIDTAVLKLIGSNLQWENTTLTSRWQGCSLQETHLNQMILQFPSKKMIKTHHIMKTDSRLPWCFTVNLIYSPNCYLIRYGTSTSLIVFYFIMEGFLLIILSHYVLSTVCWRTDLYTLNNDRVKGFTWWCSRRETPRANQWRSLTHDI